MIELEIKILLHDLKSLNSELENKKKKLEYISIYFNTKINTNNDININFNNDTENINNTNNNDINDNINNNKENIEDNINIEDNYNNIIDDIALDLKKNIDKNIDLKKIYREIVILTHPDKIKDKENKDNLIDLYKIATDAKNKNNIAQLLLVAEELKIEYEKYLTEESLIKLKDNINILKSQLLHIEQTIPWKWYHMENEKLKNIVISNYLKYVIKQN
jgi:hypothetical protein